MRRTSAYLKPFALWTDLAMQTTGMMLASAEVIGHRTTRMAQSSFPPSAKDAAEFNLMGQEKMEAATESMQAAGTAMMAKVIELIHALPRVWGLAIGNPDGSQSAGGFSRRGEIGRPFGRSGGRRGVRTPDPLGVNEVL